jgi:DNA polymerase sigma
VNFLKLQKEEDNNPLNIGTYNLGHLFYEFLKYYGLVFNPMENIVDPKDVYKNSSTFIARSFFSQYSDLIIVDPLNHNNNVAKNTRQFDKIKLAFSLGALAAREQCECGCHFEKEGYSDYMKIEHCLLKRIFNAVKRSIDDAY